MSSSPSSASTLLAHTPALKPSSSLNLLPTNASSTRIKNQLNVFQGAALIIGGTIGSGIYITPGKVVGDVGAVLPALLLWAFASFIAFVASMNYAELGSRITESGGDAPFLDAAFPRPKQLVACLYSWTRVSLVNPGYNACLSYTASKYLLAAFPFTEYTRVLASFMLVVLTAVCIPSNQTASKFMAWFTVLTIWSLLMFGTLGVLVLTGLFPDLYVADSFSSAHFIHGTSSNIGNWASATYAVLWSFDGFANLTSSLGELHNPDVNIKRSSMMGVGVVSVLYILANLTFMATMPFQTLISAGDQLAFVWSQLLFSRVGQIGVALLISLSSLSCCYVCVFSASRIAQATGNNQLIYPPKFFKLLNSRTGTPVNALVLNFVLSTGLLWIPPSEDVFWFIMNLVSYPLWVFYGLTALSLLLIKYRDRNYTGLSVHPAGPVFVLCVSVFLIIFPYFDKDLALPSALSWVYIAFGFISYWLLKRLDRDSVGTSSPRPIS